MMIATLKRLAPAAFGLLAAGLTALPAAADAVVTLRPSLEVAGETIAFSDLFDGVPAGADSDIARSPAPGASVTIDPVWLGERARMAGLDWPNATNVRRVSVRRASQTISADMIGELIADELARQHHEDYAVTLSGARMLHAPIDAALSPVVNALSYDPSSNSFTANVSLYPGATAERVAGRAEPAIELIVLARAVSRGDVISMSDLTSVRTPLSRAPGDAVMDPGEAIGMAAKRSLRAGQAIRPFDLDRPNVIARGDTVVVRFERGALALTARARALSDVAEGEQGRFVNLQSNRVVDAVAIGPGEAWLVAGAPLTVQTSTSGAPIR
ncbi:MAG: flagellar basal body P-ring formation chaperone FlgA [Maricaulaceae bacterium]|jgi:flagella basal body P-ring formation protein FlgA